MASSSKAFLVIGCLLLVLLVASEVAAKAAPEQSNESVHVEDAKGRGGYDTSGHGGGGGHGCKCCRCCRSVKEKMSFEDAKGRGGYDTSGHGGGGGGGCYHGCCGKGCC
ncbi:hypothetical protein ACHQM5_029489 [Ranunculus cassubicifolius]